MNTRPFETTDQQAVIDLWKDCGLVVPWNDPVKDIERKLKVDPDLFLVGELAGEIVASVMGGYEGHRGWINYLAVSPRHQRKGYGRSIMEVVELAIAQKGCPKINLQIRGSNTDMASFYQAIGYDIENVIGLGKRLEPDN
ncbi:MAG: GNAT family acetyltransferase [Gammaproteobacteria bacterium]|nr:GNAT family acetyltransferase [Gammaproteobacteria bacterium]